MAGTNGRVLQVSSVHDPFLPDLIDQWRLCCLLLRSRFSPAARQSCRSGFRFPPDSACTGLLCLHFACTSVSNPDRAAYSSPHFGPECLLAAHAKQGASKWSDNKNSSTLVFDFGVNVTLTAFEWFTAADEDGSDPLTWLLEASKDNSQWALVHQQKSRSFSSLV